MAGRPTTLTAKIKDKLEHAFSMGMNNTEACLYAGLAERTFYDHTKADEELSQRFEALKQKPVMLAKQVVMDDLSDGDGFTARWLLERKAPDYKNKTANELTGKDGGAIEIQESVIQPVLSLKEIEQGTNTDS